MTLPLVPLLLALLLAGSSTDDVGFTGKSVVAAIGIVGGSATSGLFRTTLP